VWRRPRRTDAALSPAARGATRRAAAALAGLTLRRKIMFKGGLLWLIGIPIPIILVLLLLGVI
jgi:hypothetical protein